MRKKNLLFVLVLVLAVALVACGPAAPEEEAAPAEEGAAEEGLPDLEGREIIMAVENAYPPFNYIDEDTGEAIGWDYDAGREICERLNCVPVFTEAAWDGLFPAMAAGEFDVAFDGITFTEERDETVDFSIIYTDTGQVLMVREEEDRFINAGEFAADESLLVSTQIATTNYDVSVELVGVDRISAFEDFPAAVQALLAGDVDACVLDSVSAQGFINANPGQLRALPEAVVGDPLALVFAPDSELIEPFNAALMAMMEDGTLDEINAAWGLPPHPAP
jgi:polar amino acid transport system substrate-binding protein